MAQTDNSWNEIFLCDIQKVYFAHSAMVTDGSRLHSYQKSTDIIASENVGSLWNLIWSKILAYSVSFRNLCRWLFWKMLVQGVGKKDQWGIFNPKIENFDIFSPQSANLAVVAQYNWGLSTLWHETDCSVNVIDL